MMIMIIKMIMIMIMIMIIKIIIRIIIINNLVQPRGAHLYQVIEAPGCRDQHLHAQVNHYYDHYYILILHMTCTPRLRRRICIPFGTPP